MFQGLPFPEEEEELRNDNFYSQTVFSFLDWSHPAFSRDQRWPNTLQVNAWLGRERGRGREEKRRGAMEYKLSVTHDHLLPHSSHPFFIFPSPLSLYLSPSSSPPSLFFSSPCSCSSPLFPLSSPQSSLYIPPSSPLLPHLPFPIPVSVVKRTQGTTTRTNVLIGPGTS